MDDPHDWIDRTLTVSQLCRVLKDALYELGLVRVTGEVSQMTVARSGHWYFTIRDRGAAMSCVMFRGANQHVRRPPQVGDTVTVTAEPDLYAPQGRLSLVVRQLTQGSAGDLAAQLEALKRKLAAEGLFAAERKRPLPQVPRAIGVATSPTGAAIRDVLKVLQRRFPGLTIYLSPCRVQGQQAPAEIVSAIERLNAHGGSDVLIVGRGGGSAEDLAAFNSEAVARAIAASATPVVSAVGHEVDVSIADLVADVRAATPSHAAELVVPERDGLLMLLDELDLRQRQAFGRFVQRRRDRVASLRPRHPRERVSVDRRRLDLVSARLLPAAQRSVALARGRVEAAGRSLDALSPERVLDRGYAVVLRDGAAVTDAAELTAGDAASVRLRRGRVDVRVEAVHP